MFRASPNSSQIDLFSNVEQFLREHDQEKLHDPDAWHNVFLDQVTKRIPEERFAELFDKEALIIVPATLANDHGGVATTPENERSLRGRQRGEVGQTYGESIPFANVTRDHCPEPRNASLQSAS